MLKKAVRLLLCDRKALWWHVRTKCLRGVAAALRPSGFYLQGKMDIDPRSWWHNPDFLAVYGGYRVPGDTAARQLFEADPWDYTRRDMLLLLLRSLVERNVAGDLAELGVYRGGTARLIHHYLPERKLYLFDTFSGFDKRDVQSEETTTGLKTNAGNFSDTSVPMVLANIAPRNDNVQAFPGYFPQSAPLFLRERSFAFVHLDADLYEPTMAGLEFFYERVTPGGFILVHDFNSWPGARRAVMEFFKDRLEIPIPMPDKSGSALITKLGV